MVGVISTLKPTIPKCAGAVLLAATQYYGSALIFMLAIVSKVFDEPATWKKWADEFQKSGVSLEEVGRSFAQELFWLQLAFNLVVGYLVVAVMIEWSMRRRDAEKRGDAL